jgi:hypothetical protein
MADSPCSRLLARRGLACYGAWQPSERTHVATYSSRGVGLHARRQGESKTQVPLPERLRAGEGGVSQPFRRGHQAGGVTHPREESGAVHTEVVLTGNVPENAALGTYECRSMEGLTGERNWAPIFEDSALNIRVVQRPFHAQRGGEFLGLEPA